MQQQQRRQPRQQQQRHKIRPRRRQEQEQEHEQPAFDQAPLARSDRDPVEKPLSRQSTMYSLHSYATSNGEAGDNGAKGHVFRTRSTSARVPRGQEEKRGGGEGEGEGEGEEASEDGLSLFGFTRTNGTVLDNGNGNGNETVGTDRFGVRGLGGLEARNEFGVRPGQQLSQQA